jgi:hypothetical protein
VTFKPRLTVLRANFILTLLLFLSASGLAYDNLIEAPGWQLIGGTGERLADPTSTQMCLSLSGSLQGSAYWKNDYAFQPGAVYDLRVRIKLTPGSAADAVIIGTGFANKDVHASDEWQEESMMFAAPDDQSEDFIRLGVWQSSGSVLFSGLEITPVFEVFRRQDGIELGSGEALTDEGYSAFYYYGNTGANCSRCLYHFDADFNTNRWDVYEGRQVVMRHEIGRLVQTSGTLSLKTSYRRDGFLEIAVSQDGQAWSQAAVVSTLGLTTIALPAEVYPCRTLFVRIKGGEPKTRMQFDEYSYHAGIKGDFPRFSGSTNSITTLTNAPELSLNWQKDNKAADLQLTLNKGGGANKEYTVVYTSDAGETRQNLQLRPGQSKSLMLPAENLGNFKKLTVFEKNKLEPVYSVQGTHQTPILEAEDYGFLIDTQEGVTFWWCDGVHKIGRYRQPPKQPRRREIEIQQARREYEPVQLVLRPDHDVAAMSVSVEPLRHESGRTLPDDAVVCYQVDYVPVRVPTDAIGSAGLWPDPLLPLRKSIALAAGQNQPIWILVYIPPDYPGGDYTGRIIVTVDGRKTTVPLRVKVWDFSLPKETHLKTAFGFYTSWVQRYHHFSDQDRLNEVIDAYLTDFARHRISPFDPFVLSPIKAQFDQVSLTAKVDFSQFDQAYEKYIKGWGFNSFRLNVQGLPSGTMHTRREGELGGYKAGSSGYKKLLFSYLRQIENHLAALGALDKAYLYWFDEPEPHDYPFVKETMMMIHEAAPRLTRMLTEQPEPELFGAVDLWCPISHRFQPEIAEQRRQLGERFWWYICTSPKEPYPGLFIDHNAVELRTWIWQSWKYNIEGILIWATNYWTSPNVFPLPELQNPYLDPMSYRSGESIAAGERSYWGNGDGRLIYPPKRVFKNNEKCSEGPVGSIRWEMLREGLEDYEYFWLVKDLTERLRQKNGSADLLRRAADLLRVPDAVTSSPTEFSKSPQPIFEHRRKLAEMILELQAAQ